MKRSEIKESILFQLDMCWQLYLYYMNQLDETEALWSFSATGLQVHKQGDGWHIDWPETESYEIGPSSIAWIMWHIIYWWSTAINANFEDGTLKKEDIPWPGSVAKAKEIIKQLYDQWVAILSNLPDAEYHAKQYAKWPLTDKSFFETALWLNGELMKNTAEIGYGRFLYASCKKKES